MVELLLFANKYWMKLQFELLPKHKYIYSTMKYGSSYLYFTTMVHRTENCAMSNGFSRIYSLIHKAMPVYWIK